ncbi:hypothetical protein D3C80_906630 [compost metagenome]
MDLPLAAIGDGELSHSEESADGLHVVVGANVLVLLCLFLVALLFFGRIKLIGAIDVAIGELDDFLFDFLTSPRLGNHDAVVIHPRIVESGPRVRVPINRLRVLVEIDRYGLAIDVLRAVVLELECLFRHAIDNEAHVPVRGIGAHAVRIAIDRELVGNTIDRNIHVERVFVSVVEANAPIAKATRHALLDRCIVGNVRV